MAKDRTDNTSEDKDPSQYVPARIKEDENLGEMLLREKIVNMTQLDEARRLQDDTGDNLAYTLAKLGYVEETKLVSFLSRQYGVPSINLDEVDVPPKVIKLVPYEVAKKHKLVPVAREGQTLIVAMSDPSNIYALDDVKFLTSLHDVEAVVASDAAIVKALQRYYEVPTDYNKMISELESEVDVVRDDSKVDVAELAKASEDAPVVKLVNMFLVDAIKKAASDIHIEPYEKDFRIRYRIDGVLYEMMRPPIRLKDAITSRIKIMSELDIAERRLPQDGRIKLAVGKEKEVDFRVSVLPTLYGEKVVLRILDKTAIQLDLTKLGFEEAQLLQYREAIHQPWGMILVTGPTGSGKSTTLYSSLTELNQTTDNISTAEDPVEMTIPGVNQVQMKEEIGLNFATALRSFLRQDPDIIMVGEIRDFETAEIAVKAALTGHMVLSTLHTNDAPSTINRLLNMGLEPFLVTASLNLILAQRLVRKICIKCKEEHHVDTKVLVDLGFTEEDAEKVIPMKGRGCNACNNTGYKGRMALYEVMPITDETKDMILQGYSAAELKREAVRMGMKSLRISGLNKIREGMTTIEEVLRITRPD